MTSLAPAPPRRAPHPPWLFPQLLVQRHQGGGLLTMLPPPSRRGPCPLPRRSRSSNAARRATTSWICRPARTRSPARAFRRLFAVSRRSMTSSNWLPGPLPAHQRDISDWLFSISRAEETWPPGGRCGPRQHPGPDLSTSRLALPCSGEILRLGFPGRRASRAARGARPRPSASPIRYVAPPVSRRFSSRRDPPTQQPLLRAPREMAWHGSHVSCRRRQRKLPPRPGCGSDHEGKGDLDQPRSGLLVP